MTTVVQSESELFEYYASIDDGRFVRPVEKYYPSRGYNGNETRQLYNYNNDKAEFNELLNGMPGWYNKLTNMIYFPMWANFDTDFQLVVDGLYSEEECNDWVLTTDYPDSAFKWTISAHPLIRFTINYRYAINRLYYNVTGHPRGFYQIGKKAINENLNRSGWAFRSQWKTITSRNIDLVIPDHILISKKFIERCPKLWVTRDLLTIIGKYWSTNAIEYKHKWNHHTSTNAPYNPYALRQIYVEECVHEYFRDNVELMDKLKKKYKDDFDNLVIDGNAETMRLDHYYNYLETGEYINYGIA
jgi:hypothetical protein